ncbi:pentatricopeptide repeat-containing protein At4g21065-like [Durio zibethinus]|uniref:Pentatricopeptide repeat-containing protein At4g21065-like n=1 Tax=Durio zibethinus TaxID=66656 RepID=A0A6P6AX90_DURZI|nr:pentatricopeptide repeat-containing protein At4g21065-like [Durio zibethinus]
MAKLNVSRVDGPLLGPFIITINRCLGFQIPVKFSRLLQTKKKKNEKQKLRQSEEKLEEEKIAYLIEKCPDTRLIRQIHAHVLTRLLPISSVSFLLSKIVGFCALSRHGDINHARKVFAQNPNPNIFSWNSLIRGYSFIGSQSKEPIFLYKKLVRKGYPSANTFTLAFVLKACSNILAFEEGQQVHAHIFRSGFGSNQFVQTGLLNFYAKCEDIGLAENVFDEIQEKNLVAWSTMISGYAMMGLVNEAFGAFREMQKLGVVPDKVTMVSVISACAVAGALGIGRWVNVYIEKQMIKTDIMLSTALVNMYAKCGCIEKAKEIFERMPVKDQKAWSSMIVGLAVHGLAEDALGAFSRMEESEVEPNHVAFVGVLAACAHSGLVSEGRRYWSSMMESGIEPSIEHYGCMVDLFCRACLVDEAYNFVQTMPFSPNPVIWRTLLIGCQKNKMLHKGEIAAEQLLALEPLNTENYILLSNFYASVSQWEKMSHVRKMMKEKGMKGVPGCTSIEIDGFVHEFVMGDWYHPEAKEIRQVLKDISERVSDSGHEPHISDVLHNVGDEEKGIYLCEHSERLAIAYGLLKTQAPVPIRVVKNLRVCSDCHEVTKIISKLYEREIIVRDRIRFHKFVNGSCSCRDYW